MKKLITLFVTMFALSAMLMSCSKEPVELKTVTISLNYELNVRSAPLKSADVNYLAFYNKYIVTRLLTPFSYKLHFQGSKGFSGNINGAWKKNDLFTLPIDTYIVTGTSFPVRNKSYNFEDDTYSDTTYVSFSDTISIDANTTSITLKGEYDCYLMLIENNDLNSCRFNYYPDVQSPMKNTENFYHVYVHSLVAAQYAYVVAINKSGFTSIIYLDTFPWSKGKYYYFTSIGGSYSLSPMSN